MGILAKLRGSLAKAFRTLSSRAGSIVRSLRKSPFPLSDRLLTDALRIAEIPSPTSHEEQRAAFILERLKALGLTYSVDEDGLDPMTQRRSCFSLTSPRCAGIRSRASPGSIPTALTAPGSRTP